MQFICHTTAHKHLVALISGVKNVSKSLVQLSWTLTNDSYLAPLCVMFEPRTIALACLEMAARLLGESLPDLGERAHPYIISEILKC